MAESTITEVLDFQVILEGNWNQVVDFYKKVEQAITGLMPEAPVKGKIVLRCCHAPFLKRMDRKMWRKVAQEPLNPNITSLLVQK